MPTVEVHAALDPALLGQVRDLIATVEARDGSPPLSDHALLQLPESRTQLTHVVARDADALAWYAQLDADVAEVAARTDPDAALAELERHGPEDLLVWSHGRRSPVGPAAVARGYARVRALWQLRRSLLDVPDAPVPDGVTIRPFVPGSDEDAWLCVNAAAFADHPEQGRWTHADIAAREGEPWFDPAGFLLAEKGDALLGFHWTKVHPDGIGEVYVLGVSPEAQGMHLGKALLAAGLNHLAGSGLDTVMLYVDESNQAAMRLYEHYGFTRHDLDAQYRRPARG
jgi:mycothiol synthase